MHDKDMAAVYEAYAPTVYRYLFCLTRDRALSEELTQETFCQALRSVKNFRGECKLSVWLCQIAKRLWYKELKRRKKAVTVPLDEEKLISPQDVEGIISGRQIKLSFTGSCIFWMRAPARSCISG